MDRLVADVLEGHIREHATSDHHDSKEAMAAADDIIDLVRASLK